MTTVRPIRGAPLLIAALSMMTSWTPTPAENIDPTDKFAWAENAGWINAGPTGAPGVQVDDFELTGWMWGENLGWVSLSCKNTGSCQSVAYGVQNNGGTLSGYAWSENGGWINFAPATAGVVIDPNTGDFSGHAWGENIGWVSFVSTGATPFRVNTTWRCLLATPPLFSPVLSVDKSGSDALLSWGAVVDASAYDVVQGELGVLLRTGGDFAAGTSDCLEYKTAATTTSHSGVPPPGDGYWYLVRAANCAGEGTWDANMTSQIETRDGEITLCTGVQ